MTQIVYTAHINFVTRSIKIIFIAYKKTNKIFFFLYIKMLSNYYQKLKERLRKNHGKSFKKNMNLSQQEKETKFQFHCKQSKNLAAALEKAS